MTTLCQDTMILGIITALSGLLNWAKATEEKTTEDVEAEVLFPHGGDGIHLRGAAAKIVYTRAVLSAIRNAHQ